MSTAKVAGYAEASFYYLMLFLIDKRVVAVKIRSIFCHKW